MRSASCQVATSLARSSASSTGRCILVVVADTSPARVVVAEAPDAVTAAIWVDALRDAGINAASFSRGHGAAFGGAEAFATHIVLVDREYFAAARTVIAEL